MITVLEYLVIAAAIGLVVFFLAAWVFGRGEQLAPLPARTSPAELPDTAPTGENIRNVRFAVGVRGYRMGDVDWTLDRLADELDRLREQVRELGGNPDELPPTPALVSEAATAWPNHADSDRADSDRIQATPADAASIDTAPAETPAPDQAFRPDLRKAPRPADER